MARQRSAGQRLALARVRDTRAAARRWATTWERSWEALDADPIVELSAPAATFSSEPFRDVHRGRDGVRRYVEGAFADEAEVRARFGEPADPVRFDAHDTRGVT